MDPQTLQALIAMLSGGGGLGGPAMTSGQTGRVMAPPASMGMPPSPAVSNPPGATLGPTMGGGNNPSGAMNQTPAPSVGGTSGNDFALRSSPPAMPSPAPYSGGPPTGPGTGGAEPTESGGRPPASALPPVPRSPLGALLMPQSFGGGGVPNAGGIGGMGGMGAGGMPPSNPWATNPLMASFMNRTPTGGLGG